MQCNDTRRASVGAAVLRRVACNLCCKRVFFRINRRGTVWLELKAIMTEDHIFSSGDFFGGCSRSRGAL